MSHVVTQPDDPITRKKKAIGTVDAIIVHLCSKYHILINNCCWESGSICTCIKQFIFQDD